MNKLIIILGAPNNENGRLSPIAVGRAETAFALYKANEPVKLLCTGGFGPHFNTTDLPHAHYVKKYLIEKGISEDCFLDFVLSSNTVDDFRKAKSVIKKEQPDILFVITSDFHIPRVRILYDLIIPYPKVVFVPALSYLPEEELTVCIQHEEKAIAELAANHFILY